MDDNRVLQLIHAAGLHEAELVVAVTRLGLAEVARILLDEVLFRAPVSHHHYPVVVQLTIGHEGQRVDGYLRAVGGKRWELLPAVAADQLIAMRVDYRAVDLIRALFGTGEERSVGYRTTSLLPAGSSAALTSDDQRMNYLGAAAQAVQAILSACTRGRPDLGELATRYHSDKYGLLHWFTPHYERHLAALRDEPVRVLEIGIGGYNSAFGGGSLKMWKHYFHRGLVFGLDIYDKSHLDEQRIVTIQGDQSDPDSLTEIAERHGPFDVIIDDGSHINEHVRTSFRVLLAHLRRGGFYVIEDLWTSYQPGYGGDKDARAAAGTSLNLLKDLVDSLHYEELAPGQERELVYSDLHVGGIHVYHNIAFIEKKLNAEGGIPSWVPR